MTLPEVLASCDLPLRILIVDDEPHVRKFLHVSLQAEGFAALEASTAEEALLLLKRDTPDLMILDLGLPDLDGREVIRAVRLTSDIPILVLTGRTEDSEKIAALEQGADDYITKPFAVQALIAHVRAAFNQQGMRAMQAEGRVSTGEITIHLDQPLVKRGDQPVSLDDEEYRILSTLARHGGRVMTYGCLAHAVWDGELPSAEARRAALQKRINGLRYKLENEPAFPRYIVTEAAVGYRLELIAPD